jgi:VIT1/CCC1 family predicted Fe2+/Mn2+ transporter
VNRRDGARQVIFGASDGVNGIVAALLGLAGASSSTIVHTLLDVALGAGLSMGAAEWLSQDSDTGFAGGVMLGGATAAASLLPAVPYMILPRTAAPTAAVCIVAAVAIAIGLLRGWATGRRRRALFETLGVLVVVVAVCAAIGAG